MTATKDKLVNTAFELFGRGGFHGVGLDRIIDVAGVSKQTFYNHFESKDDLVLAVLEHRHEVQGDMLQRWMTEIGGESPRAGVRGAPERASRPEAARGSARESRAGGRGLLGRGARPWRPGRSPRAGNSRGASRGAAP